LCVTNSDNKEDFIIITKKHKHTSNDVNIDWKNKFVFYSPSIVYGVDFSIDVKQDVFLYINNKSISVPLLFQQATRCRNINKLYFHFNQNNLYYKIKYKNFDECYNNTVKYININDKLINLCTYIDHNNDTQISNNLFLKLYCQNEYMFDCYKYNCKYNFTSLLTKKGFLLADTVGEIFF
jgi:hypothetical protein